MESQLDFFDKVVTNKTDTSRLSARAMEKCGSHAAKRKIVYEFLKTHGPSTDEEIESGTGLTHVTVSGSGGRGGLKRAGIVIDSGDRRLGKEFNRMAIVWKIAKDF